MTRLKQLALSGVVMALGLPGFAIAQGSQAPQPPAASERPAEGADAGQADRDDSLDAAAADMSDDGGIGIGTDDGAGTGDDADDGDTAGRPARGMGRMGGMDGDGDGSIGKDEFQSRRIDRLRAADTDGDGTLSPAELEGMVLKQIAERRANRLSKRLDIDGDGKVTIGEIETMRSKRFAVMDKNDDGKIDRRELRDVHPDMSRMGRDGGRDGGRGWRHGREDGAPMHRGGRDGY